jgi:membrane-bound lytic murein transglycosylase D
MNGFRPVLFILALCGLYLPVEGIAQQMPDAQYAAVASVAPEKSVIPNPIYEVDNSNLPPGMLKLMQTSRSNYLEGSNLIKAGNSEKAREAFNNAVGLLLQSDWDLTSTPTLNKYFQDLIQQIKEDESRYLLVSSDSEETSETAVLDELEDLDLIPIAVDPAFRDALIADLATAKYEIPITINEMVVKSLDYWLNRGRKYFVDGLLRSGQYRPIIEEVFREESIPLDLMYLAQVESLFRPHAVSKAKAKGIWQFTKGTAIRYGLKVTRDVDERSDPEKSTRAAARYLSDLFNIFKDWNLVLAAYNWGEGKVLRLINNTGLNDFWQLVDLKRKLPEETKNHVPMIQASVILGKNPEKYGLPTELYPPLRYTNVSISKPIDLRAAARVLSTSIEELKKLNPALKGLATPANYPDFQLKVPADSDPDIYARLASLPRAKIRPSTETVRRHRVRKGESLFNIAGRYGISINDLAAANNISEKNDLKVGTWLQVPSKAVSSGKSSKTKRLNSSINSSKATARKSTAKRAGSATAKKSGSSAVRISSAKAKRPASKDPS